MDWQEQLGEIVSRSWPRATPLRPRSRPTFDEWLNSTGYGLVGDVPINLNAMRSILHSLYRRYQSEYGDAA